MRQVFHAYPWIHREEFLEIQTIYEKYGTWVSIKKGDIIKNSFEKNQLFFLKKGLCAYYINFYMDKPRVLSLIVPGRVMGDITCITKDRVNVTVRAMRDSELLVMNPQRLLDEVCLNKDTIVLLMQSVIQKQESHLEGMIANFLLSPEERLKAFLKVLLLTYQNTIHEGWNSVPLVFSHEEFGEIVNITRVSVSRIFARWREDEMIMNQGRSLQVHASLFDHLYDWLDEYQTTPNNFI